MDARAWPTVRRWLLLAAALFLLNSALTLRNIWPTPWVTLHAEFSIELVVLVLMVVGYAELVRPPRRWVWIALTALLFVLGIGRYAEVTAPSLYGRPVNIYWDAQHLPKVAAMLAEVAPWWLVALGVLGACAFVAVLGGVLYWALGRVARALNEAPQRRALGALAVALTLCYAAGRFAHLPTAYWFALPVSATYAQQARFLIEALSADAQHALPMTPLPASDLQRVAGADVLLLFLESYGATSYDRPELATALAPARAGLRSAATETGRRVVSAFVESPTFGGQSVLAHSTLLSGVEVRETGDYNLLLAQQRETLPSRFKAAGYRGVAVMPGVRSAWPEGGFYNFDVIYGERDLDYHGPEFGWWRIPDQYALAKFDALELHGVARVPRFLFFPTINTHIPFRPTPPYQTDWQRVLGTDPFDAAAAKASQAQQPDWTHLGTAYSASFAYTFRYLADYLRARADADFVIVMLGDHQPAATVTGPGARWDVPVHVVTARREIADALLQAGFVEGMELAPNAAPVAKMAGLTAILLRAFDGSPGAPADGSRPEPD